MQLLDLHLHFAVLICEVDMLCRDDTHAGHCLCFARDTIGDDGRRSCTTAILHTYRTLSHTQARLDLPGDQHRLAAAGFGDSRRVIRVPRIIILRLRLLLTTNTVCFQIIRNLETMHD